jgi:putative SbcD/Mre11-related phosphoesterase
MIRDRKCRVIVVTDLHIGWEIALSKKGVHVPTQTPKLLKRLIALISTYKPEELLILGDVKHTVATAEMGEWHDVPGFFSELRKQIQEIYVVRGNHDGNLEPLLSENIKLLPSTGVVFGGVGFFHGHRWPSPTILKCKTLVMGHVHPVVALRDPAGFRITRQVWIRVDCDRTELTKVLLQKHKLKIENSPEKTLLKHYKIRSRVQQLFIMPSFNDFLGGRPLNESRPGNRAGPETVAGPVLRSEAVNMENGDVSIRRNLSRHPRSAQESSQLLA